ncbi:MAG TPA: galactokinase family protein [Solirubrobacteraceae bacterium]|nr:galactokinase family protein [Solirubrobacteraceae bacterium]
MVRARGPGRVNLIGEHTDYNGGLALPFAIARGITVTAEPAGGDRIAADARDIGEQDEFSLAAPERADGWRGFVRGTVAELAGAGYALRPCRLTIEGDLERGAGLSSSAALSTALCLALLAVAGERPPDDRRELARLCSRVENDWVGAETGLLDQLASLCGRAGHAIRIDFRTLAIDPVPLELGDWTLVTLDSGAAHSIAQSGYNERRRECQEACRRLGVETLSDANARDLDGLPGPLASRARHVVSENARVDAMVRALTGGDLEEAGRLLDASHASLRDDYAASVPEVERTVAALKDAGAAGARMVGGGFGGSVLALLRPGVVGPGGALVVEPGPPAALV